MSDYIKRIKTSSGDKQIDYNALANLPNLSNMFSAEINEDGILVLQTNAESEENA